MTSTALPAAAWCLRATRWLFGDWQINNVFACSARDREEHHHGSIADRALELVTRFNFYEPRAAIAHGVIITVAVRFLDDHRAVKEASPRIRVVNAFHERSEITSLRGWRRRGGWGSDKKVNSYPMTSEDDP